MAGTVRLKQGDLQQAHNLFTESLRLWESIGDQENTGGIRLPLTGLAEVAAAQGQAERAGRLFGAARALSPRSANFFGEVSSIDLDRDIAQTRAHLDQAAFEAGWAADQAMTQEQAISYALLGDERTGGTSFTASGRDGPRRNCSPGQAAGRRLLCGAQARSRRSCINP